MTSRTACYVIHNAEDLLQTLLRFTRNEREVINIDEYDRLDVLEETLTDKSKVINIAFRIATREELRRESE